MIPNCQILFPMKHNYTSMKTGYYYLTWQATVIHKPQNENWYNSKLLNKKIQTP